MKAASTQIPVFISGDELTLTPFGRRENPFHRPASDTGASRRSRFPIEERDARWVEAMEVVSRCALVVGLLFAFGACLRQFAQF